MSKKVTAVWSADLHGQSSAWARRQTLRGDSLYGLAQLVDLCWQHQAPLVLAGDSLDSSRPDSATIAAVLRQMDRLQQKGLECYYIQGQHDMAVPSWFSLHNACVSLHGQLKRIGAEQYYGLDWQPADKLPAALAAAPGCDVMVLHQVWAENMGPVCVSEGQLADVVHASTVLTGDFHRHYMLQLQNRDGKPLTMFSPGSVCLQAVDEDPHKYCYLRYDDGSVVSQALRTRPYLYSRLATKDSLDQAAAELRQLLETARDDLPEEVRKPIWAVDYYYVLPGGLQAIEAAAGDKVHLFASAIAKHEETPVHEKTAKQQAAEGGLRGCLELVCPEDTLVRRTAMRLLETRDLTEEIAAICNEYSKPDFWRTNASRGTTPS